MSYESEMLKSFKMPVRKEVEKALLEVLYKHNGVIKEFSAGEQIVDELADNFRLTEKQRTAYLKTIYRKEKRLKKSYLWHRLLFRAADSLANDNLISRPTETFRLTNQREWMLTEKGFDAALKLLDIPNSKKEFLSTKSYEVQKIVKKLKKGKRPLRYDPIDSEKKTTTKITESKLRKRGFRWAVIEAYDFKCAICGMKINSPDSHQWEVEAAHIVPHKINGKDDIWNGLALCHLHHWAFDVGWFTLLDNYSVQISSKIQLLPSDFGKFGGTNFLRDFISNNTAIFLPQEKVFYPHKSSLHWHRLNIFNFYNKV
jgi:predicted restriction endonuclease